MYCYAPCAGLCGGGQERDASRAMSPPPPTSPAVHTFVPHEPAPPVPLCPSSLLALSALLPRRLRRSRCHAGRAGPSHEALIGGGGGSWVVRLVRGHHPHRRPRTCVTGGGRGLRNTRGTVTRAAASHRQDPFQNSTTQTAHPFPSLRTGRRGGEGRWVAKIPIFPPVRAVSRVLQRELWGRSLISGKMGENGTEKWVRRPICVLPFFSHSSRFLSHFPQPHPATTRHNPHPVCCAHCFPMPPISPPISPHSPPSSPHFPHFSRGRSSLMSSTR